MLEPELEAVTDEILATIAREVPDYARPLEGSFGHGVRTGVTEALRQFVELIRSPSGGRGPGREVYVALGGGELRRDRAVRFSYQCDGPAPVLLSSVPPIVSAVFSMRAARSFARRAISCGVTSSGFLPASSGGRDIGDGVVCSQG